MRILREYKLCDGFHGDSATIILELPQETKVIDAYCKGSVIYIITAVNPSESWLVKREFKLFKTGARLPDDNELKETNLCGLVHMTGLSPVVVLECPIEEVSVGNSNDVKE